MTLLETGRVIGAHPAGEIKEIGRQGRKGIDRLRDRLEFRHRHVGRSVHGGHDRETVAVEHGHAHQRTHLHRARRCSGTR